MMRLIRALFLFTARHNINLLFLHIPGDFNILADSLSRLQVQKFRAHHPKADSVATTISADVWTV